mgnify:CR=1 FL=1
MGDQQKKTKKKHFGVKKKFKPLEWDIPSLQIDLDLDSFRFMGLDGKQLHSAVCYARNRGWKPIGKK